jgi:hypothetical protein
MLLGEHPADRRCFDRSEEKTRERQRKQVTSFAP